MRSTERDDNSVLWRAFTVLGAFTAADEFLSLAELTARSGIPKSSVHRLVRQLAQNNVLELTPKGLRLGTALFELGQLAAPRDLREAALTSLQELRDATQQTVHLAVLSGTDVLYIEKLSGVQGPLVPSRTGGRMPAYCTGLGKALLAFSPPDTFREVLELGLSARTPYTIVLPARLRRELVKVRNSGVAFEREESTRGVVCVASPVASPNGHVVAAVSVTDWCYRINTDRAARAVRKTAADIGNQLRRALPAH